MSRPTRSKALLHDTASSLDYCIVPAIEGKTRGLVVLLHGVGGNESNLIALAEALPEDLLVVLPRGPLTLASGQYAWFQVAFSAEGPKINPAQAETARLQLIALLASLQVTTGLAPDHSLMAGFSQGGIMSASVALTSPWSLAGFGILSGRILPEIAPQLAGQAALSHLRGYISHGQQDSTLAPAWADRAETWMAELGVQTQAHRYPARHELTPEMVNDFVRWSGVLLNPAPIRLHLDESMLTLESGSRKLELPLGTGQITSRYFHHQPPTPGELEAALQGVEETLRPTWNYFDGHSLLTSEAWLGELAGFADCCAEKIDRNLVEACFNQLAALSEGRSLARDALPADRQFAARLLVLRELMHQLDFTTLQAG